MLHSSLRAALAALALLLVPHTPAQAAPAPDVVTRLRFRLDLSELPVAERAAAIERTRQVLAKRLELAKLRGVELAVGGDIVRVTVPGDAAQVVADVERLVGTQGILSLYAILEETPNEARAKEVRAKEDAYRAALRAWAMRGADAKGTAEPKPVPPSEIAQRGATAKDAGWRILDNAPERKGAALPIMSARTTTGQSSKGTLELELERGASEKLAPLTRKKLAAVLDAAILPCAVALPAAGKTRLGLTGTFARNEASTLCLILPAGALPAPIALVAKEKPVPMLAAATTVLLFRHGEAYGNLTDAAKYKPEQMDTLTEKGIAQAKAAAAKLAGKKIAVLLHSPAGRATQTAELLQAQARATTVKETQNLASVRDGKTPEGRPSTFAWRMLRWKLAEDPTPEGGESLGDAAARAVAEIEAAATANPGATIIVVSHSDICAAIAAYALGTPMWQAYATHHLGNAESLTLTISKTRAWQCGKP